MAAVQTVKSWNIFNIQRISFLFFILEVFNTTKQTNTDETQIFADSLVPIVAAVVVVVVVVVDYRVSRKRGGDGAGKDSMN